jgi:hypothetical protein
VSDEEKKWFYDIQFKQLEAEQRRITGKRSADWLPELMSVDKDL